MRLLITDGSGMVGRNLLEHPRIKEFEVFAPTSREVNLCDYQKLNDYLLAVRPDIIVHAAGKVGGIQANMKEPVRFLLDNLDMGRNLIVAAYGAGTKKVINLGSSCMYPKDAENPLQEELVLKGELEPTNEGYALAKIMTARLCEYISKENPEYQYKTIIPCNLYGRWDKFDPHHSHLIPAIIHKIHQACVHETGPVEIWGDGSARREFMYAGDLADFILHSIDRYESLPSMTNVGLGADHSINEYYRIVSEVIGYKGEFQHDLTKPVGMKQKVVDVRNQELLGWKPSTGLVSGIRKTYEFYLTER